MRACLPARRPHEPCPCAAYRGAITLDPDELTDLVFPEPDPVAVDSDAAAHAEPRPVDRFRQTAAGSVVAAGLLGLRDALEGRPEKEEVTIVSEAPTRPVDGFTLVFDADDPNRLTVVLPTRPDPHGE